MRVECRGNSIVKTQPEPANVPDPEGSTVRLDAAPTDCESKPQAGPVLPALLEWQEQILGPNRQTATRSSTSIRIRSPAA